MRNLPWRSVPLRMRLFLQAETGAIMQPYAATTAPNGMMPNVDRLTRCGSPGQGVEGVRLMKLRATGSSLLIHAHQGQRRTSSSPELANGSLTGGTHASSSGSTTRFQRAE